MNLPEILKPLARELDYDRPQVLIVVGTGVSLEASGESCASWLGLLENGITHLVNQRTWTKEIGDANRTLLQNAFARSPFDLNEALQRAESISNALGGASNARFAAWLESSIGTLKARRDHMETLDKIRDLYNTGALILTTNYDNLLCDVTGDSFVTWEDHEEFQRVVNRTRRGILHIHGHWSRPSSVILGSSSYARIVAEPNLQTAFRSLAMTWSWLYVGCGNGGLNDPNLGKLLQWVAKAFPNSKRDDYFLSTKAAVQALAAMSSLPPRLHFVEYARHEDLPEILHAITPAARCAPFEPLGPDCDYVRRPGTSPESIPFPSWTEYLAGEVPRLPVDDVVELRLSTHHWAYVRDVASVGKTTLAIRQATGPEQRKYPTYYLDLKDVAEALDESPEETTEAEAALRRLTRPGVLFILDNANRKPHLVQRLWTQWDQRRRGSQMLVLATEVQSTAANPTDDALRALEQHTENAPIGLRPTPNDLAAVFRYVVRRLQKEKRVALPEPTEEALTTWHQPYGCDLASFAAAVTNEYGNILKPSWNYALPPAAAADWMERRHLRTLTLEDRQNLICLAVFAGQEFELEVQQDGLPHPQRANKLLNCDLVKRVERGQLKHKQFSLREPGWGELVLGTCEPPPDKSLVMQAAALRSPFLCLQLINLLRSGGHQIQLDSLWSSLENPAISERIANGLLDVDLLSPVRLAIAAAADHRDGVASNLWVAIEANPLRLTARALESSLLVVAAFLDAARLEGQRKLTDQVWGILYQQSSKLAEKALQEQLHIVAIFLRAARAYGATDLARKVWLLLADRIHELVMKARETPLGGMVGFLRIATQHEQLFNPADLRKHTQMIHQVWAALADDTKRLVDLAFETQLNYLASFLSTAREHGQCQLV